MDDSFELFEEAILVLENFKSGVGKLEKFEKLMKKAIRLDPDGEFMSDSEDIFSDLINDSEFRSDKVGPGAIKEASVFSALIKFAEYNENIEVVLATAPYCPADVLEILERSVFSWEEDGTTQALARNQSDPDLLTRLAERGDSSTRFDVAANSRTPLKVLEKLSKDPEYSDSLNFLTRFNSNAIYQNMIRYAVAGNSKVSKDLLNEMVVTLENGESLNHPYIDLNLHNEALRELVAYIKIRLDSMP